MNNIFLNNKYFVWYTNIITCSQNKARVKLKKNDINYQYFERHHIIPRCMSGTDTIDNLVLLTPREHYICHLLLTKICVDKKHHHKMLYAFNRITNKSSPNILNSSMYERIRIQFSDMRSKASSGELNNFFGKKHTEETKLYMSNVCPRYGKDNGFSGKTHTPEIKKILSCAAKMRINTPPPPQQGAKNHFSKFYRITYPDGTTKTIKCLKTFVNDNNMCMHTIKIYKDKGIIPTLNFARPYRVKNMQQKRNCEGYSVSSIIDPSGIFPSIDQTVTGI